ncbi:MAG TPA: signal peptide peptidase SppA [Thermoanaerobaculia bacterium]|nr:signal peptide peptidase SppA [Thermoanaerobaculia bacterium]
MTEQIIHEEPRPASDPPIAGSATPAIPAPSSSRRQHLFWGAVSGCLVLFVLLSVLGAVLAVSSGRSTDMLAWPSDRVAVIPIEGEIFDARETIEQLHRFADTSSVKALVIRINSPGGAIVPSQEIFEEIRKIRAETGKPIVASLDSLAASGGYYIAVGCDTIVANPGSLTGSIGVIAQWFNLEHLVKWAKLDPVTITSGDLKDAGSPFRQLSNEEREYLQNIVSQLHRQFVRAVIEGREGKLTEAQVLALADGRVFTGEEAKQLNLVDELGNLHDAAALAASMAGIRGTPRLVYPRRAKPSLLDLISGSSDAETMLRKILAARTQFLYRW